MAYRENKRGFRDRGSGSKRGFYREYRREGDKQYREHPFHGPRRQYRQDQKKAEPRPLDDGRCNPLCPLFVCSKKAYKLRFDKATGRRYVFCTWIGDECIGASCQYASCRMNYLLPDGTCGWVKQKKLEQAKIEEEFEEEYEDELERKARSFLGKRYGKKSELEDIY